MTPDEIETFAGNFVDAVQAGDGDLMRTFYAPGAKIWHNTDGIEQSIEVEMAVADHVRQCKGA